MQVVNLSAGTTTSNVSPNTATLTAVNLVIAASNLRGIILYSACIECEDLPDAVVTLGMGTNFLRAVRGGFANLPGPVMIPAGVNFYYATLRLCRIDYSYTVL